MMLRLNSASINYKNVCEQFYCAGTAALILFPGNDLGALAPIIAKDGHAELRGA
jgi:hypothetical protein